MKILHGNTMNVINVMTNMQQHSFKNYKPKTANNDLTKYFPLQ